MSVDVNSSFIQRYYRKFLAFFRAVFMNFEWATLAILATLPSDAFEKSTVVRTVLSVLGLVIFVAGLFLRLWARGYNKKGAFVLDGPYRYVQNPDELGSLSLYVGMCLLLGVIWSWVIAISLVVLVYFACVSGIYEDNLKKKVGATFPRYRTRVKRWIPSLYPAVNRSGFSFSWIKAIRDEYTIWLWLVGILIVFWLRSREILPLS